MLPKSAYNNSNELQEVQPGFLASYCRAVTSMFVHCSCAEVYATVPAKKKKKRENEVSPREIVIICLIYSEDL